MDKPPPRVDPHRIVTEQGFVAPDMVGHVEGWRVWVVPAQAPAFGLPPKLRSVSSDDYWAHRRVMRATCNAGSPCTAPALPGDHCTCGCYSAKTYEHLMSLHYHPYDLEEGFLTVMGRVANWGKVVEGSQGWRCEFSYPVELFVPFEAYMRRGSTGVPLGTALQEAYGVRVSPRNFLKPFVRAA